MHDEEIGVVDVELDGLEEILHRLLLRTMAIDEIFARAAQDYLAGNGDLGILFEADG